MLAVYAARISPDDPLSAVEVGERPEPVSAPGWVTIEVRAAALTITTCGRCAAPGYARTSCR